MRLFRHANRERSPATQRVWAIYEVIYTIVDFGAALCFTAGSVFFFWDRLETPAVWLFTAGSVLFMTKPSLRLAREIQLLRMGHTEKLAERLDG